MKTVLLLFGLCLVASAQFDDAMNCTPPSGCDALGNPDNCTANYTYTSDPGTPCSDVCSGRYGVEISVASAFTTCMIVVYECTEESAIYPACQSYNQSAIDCEIGFYERAVDSYCGALAWFAACMSADSLVYGSVCDAATMEYDVMVDLEDTAESNMDEAFGAAEDACFKSCAGSN